MSQTFIDQWEQAVAGKDLACIESLFAPDFTLISPVAFKPYNERKDQLAILRAILEVMPDLRYTRREPLAKGALLIFAGTVSGLSLEGMDLFDLDDSGLTTRLTVMVRPLKAAHIFAESMARKLGA